MNRQKNIDGDVDRLLHEYVARRTVRTPDRQRLSSANRQAVLTKARRLESANNPVPPGPGRTLPEILRQWLSGLRLGAVAAVGLESRWMFGLGTAAAVGLIVVFLSWPHQASNTAVNLHLKPLIQIAMLDSMGLGRGAVGSAGIVSSPALSSRFFAWNPTLSAPQGNQQLATTLKESLQQTNLEVFSETADLKKWLEEWPSDDEQPAFKVWYDRDAGEVQVWGRWRRKLRIEEKFTVRNEKDLPTALQAASKVVNQVVKP